MAVPPIGQTGVTGQTAAGKSIVKISSPDCSNGPKDSFFETSVELWRIPLGQLGQRIYGETFHRAEGNGIKPSLPFGIIRVLQYIYFNKTKRKSTVK